MYPRRQSALSPGRQSALSPGRQSALSPGRQSALSPNAYRLPTRIFVLNGGRRRSGDQLIHHAIMIPSALFFCSHGLLDSTLARWRVTGNRIYIVITAVGSLLEVSSSKATRDQFVRFNSRTFIHPNGRCCVVECVCRIRTRTGQLMPDTATQT
jgi:hypothetical protein